MEKEKISVIFKNDIQSIYEANYTYALLKGKLSKKHTVKIFVPAFIVATVISFLIFEQENLLTGKDIYAIFIMICIMIITLIIMIFINRALNKAQIKNFSKICYDYGFDAKNPVRADFYEEKMILQSGYSMMNIPYSEFDYVISDKVNFVFGVGNDLKVRNIPKTNQDPDTLFAIDNLLKGKLKERFIYKM